MVTEKDKLHTYFDIDYFKIECGQLYAARFQPFHFNISDTTASPNSVVDALPPTSDVRIFFEKTLYTASSIILAPSSRL